MRVLLVGLWFVLGTVATSSGQGFVVDETSPAGGATDVPLHSTVRFEFNDAVDQKTNLNLAFMVIPRRAVRITRVAIIPDDPQRECPSLSSDLTCPSVVEYAVIHEPETDYTWLAYAVQTRSSKQMTEPHVMRYTTASSLGQHRVSGQVTASAASAAAASSPIHQTTLRHLAEGLKRNGYGRPVYETAPESAASYGKRAASDATSLRLDEPHTLVFLLDSFTTTEQAWDLRAATVIRGETGTYHIDHVRSGRYYPIAVRYTDGARREIAALGYYDADGDGNPDPIDTQAGDVSDVDLPMQAFALTTAAERLQLARDSASHYAGDQRLIGLRATAGARAGGTAYTWAYHFHSPDESLHTVVEMDPLQAVVRTSSAPANHATYSTVPEDFLDSDVAVEQVLEEGGGAFIEGFPLENTNTIIQGGPVYVRPSGSSDTFWDIQLYTITSTQVKSFERLVNMRTGETTATAVEAPEPLAARLHLAPAYPHPVVTHTTLPFHVDTAREVTVAVFDVLGRHVVTLIDRTLVAPGDHSVTWQARGLPSGVYVARLSAGSHVATRTLMLVRP